MMSDDNQVWNYVTRRDKEIQCCFCGIIFHARKPYIWQHLTNEHKVIREPTYVKLNKKSGEKKGKVKSAEKKEKKTRSPVWEFFTKCQNETDRAICNICHISFPKLPSSSTSNMLAHLKSKHALLGGKIKAKTHQCSYCGRKFYYNRRKRECEARCTGDPRSICPYDGCSMRFTTFQSTKKHISSIHKKLKPHICETCGRAFAQGQQLRTHLRVHTGETPFECERCHKKFKFHATRNSHKCVLAPKSE